MTSILFSGDICELCCSDFNKTKNAKVNCPNCDYPVCRECTRTYLLGTMDSPHCLNCKNRWELDTLIDNTLKSFVNGDYKQHRKKMLMDHEKSRMPETMQAVENYKKVKELTVEYKAENTRLKELEQEYENLKWKVSGLKHTLNSYKNGESKEDKREFKRKCPADGCLGFLSTQWKCGLCNTKVCSKCFAIKSEEEKEEHVCNEDDVKSAEAIKKETRNCPTCGTSIYKILGCDQMWCVQCHTAFSWKTGLKVNGVIHNPHFFQWQSQGAQEAPVNLPGVEMCGGIPFWHGYKTSIRTLFNQLYKINNNELSIQNIFKKFANDLYRGTAHFSNVELDRVRARVNTTRDNKLLRVKYMANEMTEESFKSKIVSKDKKYHKLRAILEVYELVNVVLSETLRDVNESSREFYYKIHNENYQPTIDDYTNWMHYFETKMNRVKKVREYANYELLKISVLYSQTVGIIDKDCYTINLKFKKTDIELYKDKHHLIGC